MYDFVHGTMNHLRSEGFMIISGDGKSQELLVSDTYHVIGPFVQSQFHAQAKCIASPQY